MTPAPSNEDTGAITGWDAGGFEIKTAESIVPEDSFYQECPYDSFYVNGLTVKLGDIFYDDDEKMTETTYSEFSAQQKYLWNSLYSYWMKSGLGLITESYGSNYSFNNSSAMVNTIYVSLVNRGNTGTLATTWSRTTDSWETITNLQLDINLYCYNEATGKDGEVTNGQEYLDRTIAHELTHAVMYNNINYCRYLPVFIKEGMSELTHGIDDVRTNDIMKLAGDSSLLEKALFMAYDYDGVDVPGVHAPSYAGGYMFLRYLARQASDFTIDNSDSDTTIKTFYGNDTITNGGSNVTIDSGAGDDSITNSEWSGAVSMNGGLGNDTLQSESANNVTLTGGEGNDTFIYRPNEGTDIITDYSAGDMLKILKSNGAQGTFNDSSFSGNRLTLTIDGGGSVVFSGVNGDSSFNINGTTYKINNGKLK